MSDKHRPSGAEPWEDQLRQGLDALSDLGGEQPPNIANLQMMVAQVQQEQRARTLRDLSLFWLCGLLVLGVLYVMITREPLAFLILQGMAVAVPLAALAVTLRGRKPVAHDE